MKKFFSIMSIVAVAFVFILGSGISDTAGALTVRNGDGYSAPAGQVNVFGLDGAGNAVRVIEKDAPGAGQPALDSYGLAGRSQQ